MDFGSHNGAISFESTATLDPVPSDHFTGNKSCCTTEVTKQRAPLEAAEAGRYNHAVCFTIAAFLPLPESPF